MLEKKNETSFKLILRRISRVMATTKISKATLSAILSRNRRLRRDLWAPKIQITPKETLSEELLGPEPALENPLGKILCHFFMFFERKMHLFNSQNSSFNKKS